MKSREIKYFIPAIIWAVAITIVSSIPDLGAPPLAGITFTDKLAHFTEYFILAFGLAYGLYKTGKPVFVIVVVIGTVFGALDETHQYFVPGRSSELLDLVADMVGSAFGAGAFCILKHKLLKSGTKSVPAESAK